jgi:hypothetical protein
MAPTVDEEKDPLEIPEISDLAIATTTILV